MNGHPDQHLTVHLAAPNGFVLAFLPDDCCRDDATAGAWSLYATESWQSGATTDGGQYSLPAASNVDVDDLAVWLRRPNVLDRPVAMERSLHWMDVGADRRVFPLYRVTTVLAQ